MKLPEFLRREVKWQKGYNLLMGEMFVAGLLVIPDEYWTLKLSIWLNIHAMLLCLAGLVQVHREWKVTKAQILREAEEDRAFIASLK